MQPEEPQPSSWQIEVLAWLETHKLHLIYSGAAALAVWLAAFTYNHVRAGQEASANAALAALNKSADRTGKQVPTPAADYLEVAKQHAGTKAADRALIFGADRLFTEGKYLEAKAHFEKYRTANPTGAAAASALLGIAACQEALGEVDKSMATHKQVIDQHGNSPEAHTARLALGLLHEQKQQPDQALRLYDEVLRAKPVSVWRTEAEMRREQLVRRHPQLALGTPTAVPAATTPVAPTTNAPAKK